VAGPCQMATRCVADRLTESLLVIVASETRPFQCSSSAHFCRSIVRLCHRSVGSQVRCSSFFHLPFCMRSLTLQALGHVQSGTGQAATSDRRSACQHHNNHPNLSLSLATTSSPPRGQLSIAVRLCRLDITQAWTSTVSCTVLSQAQANPRPVTASRLSHER